MTLARTTSLALSIAACGISAGVPPHTGAADSALAAPVTEVGSGVLADPLPTEAPEAGGAELNPQGFAAPRPVDRDADPIRPTPMGGAAVRLGAPYTPIAESPGVLRGRDPAEVLAELEYNAGHLQRCWEARAKEVRAGTIVIHAHLDPNGLVSGQCVGEDPIGDAQLLRCANDLIAMGRYPELEDGSEGVVFSFHFDGGNG